MILTEIGDYFPFLNDGLGSQRFVPGESVTTGALPSDLTSPSTYNFEQRVGSFGVC
jgi:hypothetical protein